MTTKQKEQGQGQKVSGFDFDGIMAGNGSMKGVLEVLEAVPDGVVAERHKGEDGRWVVDAEGRFRTLAAFATHVYRKTEGELSARLIGGEHRMVRLHDGPDPDFKATVPPPRKKAAA